VALSLSSSSKIALFSSASSDRLRGPACWRAMAPAFVCQRAAGKDWTAIFDPRWTMTVWGNSVGSGALGVGGNTNLGTATGDSGG
jgi:hypothetical protein